MRFNFTIKKEVKSVSSDLVIYFMICEIGVLMDCMICEIGVLMDCTICEIGVLTFVLRSCFGLHDL